ncbi:hypothetical protein PL321_11365 [Caloramator sp. mosi_1]|uniref:hypothetical protein n=1 Tax=Caloramator sp. mosi_1 TaxID=3023090 RepID=UPI002361C0A2|nr:hypothetical protein [Caloramator sp. mosi_1]WDC83356.1 hypothetical protein PL321_11365 [Caloramator sp. mosi_1]
MKPYTEIRGISKVQIFNSKTGEIEVESVSENVVTYAQSIILYYNFFISYICGIGITQNNFIPKIDADPFKNIYIAQLTNQGVEPVQEDPFQIRVPITHRVRGYADRYLPYSGGDTSRGTINVAETKFYKEGNDFIVHFVFDFPTHAGNGDFDCIYWANDSYSRAYELDTKTFNTGKQFNNFADVIPMEDSRNDNILIAVCTDKETVADNKIKYKLSRIYVFDKDMNFLFYRDMEQYINSLPMNSTIVFNMRSDGKIALIDNTNQKFTYMITKWILLFKL